MQLENAMKSRNNWIIDADIARSAGETNHPLSKNSRNFLKQIQRLKKKIIFNQKLKLEWDKHSSLFTKRWLASMIARRLIDYSESPINFSNIIVKSNISLKEKRIANKDLHLIELALNCDKAIASGDDEAKFIFVKITRNNFLLNNVVWINPKKDGENVINLLNTKLCFNSQCYLRNN